MPGFRHLDELVSLVLRHLGDGHIILRKQVFDNRVDRLFGLKRPLANLFLGHASLVVKGVIKKDIDHQQRFHHHAVYGVVPVVRLAEHFMGRQVAWRQTKIMLEV